MKATFVSKEKNDVRFTMEFSPEEFEEAVARAYRQNKHKFALNGFRKGKAPRKLIEAQFGEGVFFEDAVNGLFSENYPAALDELDITVIDRPSAEFDEISKEKPLVVTVNVTAYPEIEVKDYKGVEVEKTEYPVTDEEVDREIESLRKRNARMVLVEDRPVRDGDMILLDYKGFVDENQFEGGTAERYPLKIGSGAFIPGFEEQLTGVSVGEEKEVKVTFPQEYHSADLAGKEAVFHCVVREIKEEDLPELNDEFAKDVSEHDTLDALKTELREKMVRESEERGLNKTKNDIIEKVYHANDIEVPAVMIEDETNQMLQELSQQLSYQGMNLDQYLGYLQKDLKEFRESMREDAAKKVKTRLLVEAVARTEDLQVSQEEVDKEIESMAAQYKMEADKLKEMMAGDNFSILKKDLKMRKAVEFLYENAKLKAAGKKKQ